MHNRYDGGLMVTVRLFSVLLVVVLAGCSSSPQKPAVEAVPEPVTGLHALAQMYAAARVWQPDVLVLRVNSIDAGSLKPQPGRSAVWQGTFVSPTAGQSRTFTFSVMDISTSLRTGVFPDPATTFSARGQTTQGFNINGARKDTDEVYATALKHADVFVKDHPNQQVNFLLELDNRAPEAMWRVFWGTSAASSPFSVLIDAASGEFYRTFS